MYGGPLDHRDYFCFIFLLGCQSVRDRTAQAGAPILKCTVFICQVKERIELHVHVHNKRVNFQKTDGVLAAAPLPH